MLRKFSSELCFEPKPPRTELRVQFRVCQKLLNWTLGPVQGSTKLLWFEPVWTTWFQGMKIQWNSINLGSPKLQLISLIMVYIFGSLLVTSPIHRTLSFIDWTLPKFWSMRHLMRQQMLIFHLFIALVLFFFYDWTHLNFDQGDT